MRIPRGSIFAAAVAIAAGSALPLAAPRRAEAHGGQYRPPPEDPPPPPEPDPPPPPDGEVPPREPQQPEPAPGPTPVPTPVPRVGTPTLPPAPPPPGSAPRTPTVPDPTPDPREREKGGRRSQGASLEEWTSWWYYARDRWIARPGAAPSSGDESLGATAPPADAPVEDGAAARRRAWMAAVARSVRGCFPDDDVEIFTGCAVALGKAGDPRDAAALLRALRGRYADPSVRESCVLGLGLLGRGAPGAREALLGILRDRTDSSRLRGMAALALGISGDPAAAPALLAAARQRGPSRDPAAPALVALGLLGEPLVVQDIVGMLADESGTDARALRPYAAFALGRIGGAEAVRALGRALGDSDPQVRRSSVLALAECAPADASVLAPALAHLSREDRDRPTRNFAVVALGRIGGPSAHDALARCYSLGDRGERNFAALGLGLLGRGLPEGDARSRIAGMLRTDFENREDADFRGALATALGLLGDRRAAPPLLAVVKDRGDPELRAHCALALGLLGAGEAAEALRAMARERGEPALQREAALALGLLRDPGAAKVLADLVGRASTEYVRASAAAALGNLGGEEAARALEGLLLDPAASAGARGQAAVGLGLLLDPRPVGALASVGAGLNYLAPTPALQEVLTIP